MLLEDIKIPEPARRALKRVAENIRWADEKLHKKKKTLS